MGKIETPFFGVSQNKREGRGGRSAPFFAVGGFVGRRRRCQAEAKRAAVFEMEVFRGCYVRADDVRLVFHGDTSLSYIVLRGGIIKVYGDKGRMILLEDALKGGLLFLKVITFIKTPVNM
jgi:hypothetical protein